MVELLSAHAIDVRHMRTGHNHTLPSNPGTQWVVVSAGIAQERVVMARSPTVDVDRKLATAVGGTSAA